MVRLVHPATCNHPKPHCPHEHGYIVSYPAGVLHRRNGEACVVDGVVIGRRLPICTPTTPNPRAYLAARGGHVPVAVIPAVYCDHTRAAGERSASCCRFPTCSGMPPPPSSVGPSLPIHTLRILAVPWYQVTCMQARVHAVLPGAGGRAQPWPLLLRNGHVVARVHLRGAAAAHGAHRRLLHPQPRHHARVPVLHLVPQHTRPRYQPPRHR